MEENAINCENQKISSEPFPKPAAVPLADVNDINQRKSRTRASNGAETNCLHPKVAGKAAHLIENPQPLSDLKAPSCPSLSFPHPLPQITKTVSGFAKGLRTYPIPPRCPKACSVPGPMWGAAVKRNRIKTCLTSLPGEEPFLQVIQPLLVHLQGLGAHYNPCSWGRAHQS